jgi:two-component system cell cycle sensor histidine kinase/response regulator CckA
MKHPEDIMQATMKPIAIQAPSILVCEDSPVVRIYVRRTLESAFPDAHVHEASDGKEGLAVMKTNRVDLIVTDLTMPGLNGRQLIAKVKALRPGMPVLLCTGFNEGWDSAENGAGADEFLQKPASLAELTQAIHRALKR